MKRIRERGRKRARGKRSSPSGARLLLTLTSSPFRVSVVFAFFRSRRVRPPSKYVIDEPDEQWNRTSLRQEEHTARCFFLPPLFPPGDGLSENEFLIHLAIYIPQILFLSLSFFLSSFFRSRRDLSSFFFPRENREPQSDSPRRKNHKLRHFQSDYSARRRNGWELLSILLAFIVPPVSRSFSPTSPWGWARKSACNGRHAFLLFSSLTTPAPRKRLQNV